MHYRQRNNFKRNNERYNQQRALLHGVSPIQFLNLQAVLRGLSAAELKRFSVHPYTSDGRAVQSLRAST